MNRRVPPVAWNSCEPPRAHLVAPFGRGDFSDSSPWAAALGHGLFLGMALALVLELRRLRALERSRGVELLVAPQRRRFARAPVFERETRR